MPKHIALLASGLELAVVGAAALMYPAEEREASVLLGPFEGIYKGSFKGIYKGFF